jgi:hypothetical protein
MQSVPITTKDVSSNPAHGDAYSIQHYVKMCVSYLCSLVVSTGTPVSLTSKTGLRDITEILLKVALNAITLIQHLRNIFNKHGT